MPNYFEYLPEIFFALIFIGVMSSGFHYYLSDLLAWMFLLCFPVTFLLYVDGPPYLWTDKAKLGIFLKASVVLSLPIFLGFWWAMFAARRLREERAWRRIGLILAGCGLVIGFAAL